MYVLKLTGIHCDKYLNQKLATHNTNLEFSWKLQAREQNVFDDIWLTSYIS
jgi:hypothetical protein